MAKKKRQRQTDNKEYSKFCTCQNIFVDVKKYDEILVMKIGTYPLLSVKQVFHYSQQIQDGVRKCGF